MPSQAVHRKRRSLRRSAKISTANRWGLDIILTWGVKGDAAKANLPTVSKLAATPEYQALNRRYQRSPRSSLRGLYDAMTIAAEAKRFQDRPQVWLLAVAAIYDGATWEEAAKIDGETIQIVRDRLMKFSAPGPDRLIDRKAPHLTT